eukprot:5350708-Lingulodinium_polyedra.AAC.1
MGPAARVSWRGVAEVPSFWRPGPVATRGRFSWQPTAGNVVGRARQVWRLPRSRAILSHACCARAAVGIGATCPNER